VIHTRLQLDPFAQVSVRPRPDGRFEVVVLEQDGDASAVIELSGEQLAKVCEAASEL
jgi:hypothetical protein